MGRHVLPRNAIGPARNAAGRAGTGSRCRTGECTAGGAGISPGTLSPNLCTEFIQLYTSPALEVRKGEYSHSILSKGQKFHFHFGQNNDLLTISSLTKQEIPEPISRFWNFLFLRKLQNNLLFFVHLIQYSK